MNLPLGVRRDGSYYTRIEWASHTESDPTFWVVNLIRDDTERNGGTWGANTMGPGDRGAELLRRGADRFPHSHFPKRGPGHFDSRGVCEDDRHLLFRYRRAAQTAPQGGPKSIPWIGNS